VRARRGPRRSERGAPRRVPGRGRRVRRVLKPRVVVGEVGGAVVVEGLVMMWVRMVGKWMERE
jgi:hypothetical protein